MILNEDSYKNIAVMLFKLHIIKSN